MTENENLDQDEREVQRDTTTRGGGALIGRFLAVGLFVVLGTVAVIQSLGVMDLENPLAKSETKKTDVENNNKIASTEKPDTKDEKPKSEISKPASSRSTFGGSSLADTKPKMPLPKPGTSSGTIAKALKPATQTTPVVVTPKITPGGGSTFGRPTPSSSTPVSTLQPRTAPKNRIAQLPGSGSARTTFGIGGPATSSPQTLGGTVGDLKQKAGAAVDSAANRFNQLGKTAKDAASGLTDRTKAAFGQTTSRLGSTTKPKEPVVATSPFKQSSGIPKIEARSSLGTPAQKRPFSGSPTQSGGFQSRPLNPISKSSTGQTRTPSAPVGTRSSTFPPARTTSTPSSTSNPRSTTTQDPFAKTQDNSTQSSSFPPRNSTRDTARSTPTSADGFAGRPRRPATASSPTRLPSATSRAPVMQASRVSPKPGDRQYEGVQSPSMIIQKFSPREIQVNETADFEVKIRNVGRVSVDDVLVVDRVPEGARFIDANPKPSTQSRNGELQWQLGTMKPGEERTILLQLQPTEAGEIGSVAQFFFGGRATNRTKVTQPKLKISHTADPKVLIGNDVIFDVVVENTGNGPARDVVIQEEVPELLEYQDGSRELEYEVGTLLPGQSRRLQLGLRAARVGRLKNIMFASAKGGLQSKHQTDVEIIAPKLTTTSEGPTRRYIKRKVTHTFTVGNQGTAEATNLRLIARLPSGLRYVDANNRGRYDRNSHSVVWQMPNLAAGGSGDVEIITSPVEAGEQNIKFQASADLNQQSETVQNLNVEHLVDVFFDIDDVVDPIEIGADTEYRIRLVNQGTQAASNVRLQIDCPPGLQPKSVDGDLRNQIRGQQILFEPITSLRPGEELKVSVVASGRTAGDHRIVVNMKADGRDTPVSKEETTRVYSDR